MRIFAVLSAALVVVFSSSAVGQRTAILIPEPSALAARYANGLNDALEKNIRVVDLDLAASAYSSITIVDPFNQQADQAKKIGPVVGCDRFILLKAQTDRRSSSARPSYFEASAFIFLVDARTGRLLQFLRPSKQENTLAAAEQALVNDVSNSANVIRAKLNGSHAGSSSDPEFEMYDPDSRSTRPAMPYRRIKPEYTDLAFLFDVKATVDAEVSIDEKGVVKNVDITRWAGFGLEEAVVDAVNKMNWRPGERNGKPLPMRVLLRYNFTKIEKEP
jgi:hypothetical protein